MAKQPGKRESARLGAKLRPSQARARQTFEMILAVAGELLAEVGFERLTTNLVCERAGITPPALYRYFPNKYALLGELGQRLMQAQDEAVFAWIESGGLAADTLEASIAKYEQVQREVNRVTRAFPGGVWILRAMRAAPLLQDVRIRSRDHVARHTAEHILRTHPGLSPNAVHSALLLTIELMYAASEMVLEQPDMDEAVVTREVSRMMSLYHADLLGDARRGAEQLPR